MSAGWSDCTWVAVSVGASPALADGLALMTPPVAVAPVATEPLAKATSVERCTGDKAFALLLITACAWLVLSDSICCTDRLCTCAGDKALNWFALIAATCAPENTDSAVGEIACTLATDILPICEPDKPMMVLGDGALPASVGTTAFGAVVAGEPWTPEDDADDTVVEALALKAPPTVAGLLALAWLNKTDNTGLTACIAACCEGVMSDSCEGVNAINWAEDKPPS